MVDSIWRVPNWRRLWAGSAISVAGDVVFDVTVVLWIATRVADGQSWGPLAVTGITMCAVIPVLLFGPAGGVLADRWRLRTTTRNCHLAQMVLIGAMIPLTFSVERLGHLPVLIGSYVLVFAANTAGTLSSACRIGLVSAAIPSDHRRQSFSFMQGTSGTIAIVGPPVAAPLLFAAGPWLAFTLNALSFAVAAVLTSRLDVVDERTSITAEEGVWSQFAEGVRTVFGNPTLRALLISLAAVTAGTAPIGPMQVFFVTENLGEKAALIGFLSASIAIGATVGAFTSPLVGKLFRSVPVMYVSLVAASAVLLVIYSQVGSLVVACVVLVLIGIPFGSVNAVLSPFILDAAPPGFIGRISGIFAPIQQLATLLAVAVAGVAATALGPVPRDIAGLTIPRVEIIYAASGLVILLGLALTARPLLRSAAVAPEV